MSHVQTYSAQAIDYIKQCLLDGTLMPGDPIRETEIAEHLGISRGPVREALQTLLQQGLVTGRKRPSISAILQHRKLKTVTALGVRWKGPALSSPWISGMMRPWPK